MLRVSLFVLGITLAAGPSRADVRPALPVAPTPKHVPATTMVHGDNHSFLVCPPEGWVVDDSSGLGSRIRVVFYPNGQKWQTADVVMYANPLHQNKTAPRPLREMIARDVDQFRRQSPKARVTEVQAVTTIAKKTAEVRFFSPEGGLPTEAVAYVPEDDLVMLLVLNARTAAAFQGALPAFRWLVTNYQYIGSDEAMGQ